MEAGVGGGGFLPPVEAGGALTEVPSLVLAYLGDAYFELLARNMVFSRGKAKVRDLHRATVQVVNANNQAAIYKAIEGLLTEEELGVARRGRNAKSGGVPKNIDVQTYRLATGLECLVGYWYLKGDGERLKWLYEHLEGNT